MNLKRFSWAGIAFSWFILTPATLAEKLDGGIAMSNPHYLPEKIRDKEIDAVREAADRIRVPVNWAELQPAEGTPVDQWNWKNFDGVIESARPGKKNEKDLSVLIILGTVPGWANGEGGYSKPAKNPELFQRYCYEVAKRYLPKGVNSYQLGNEVNLPHPGWIPDGKDYFKSFLQPGATGVWKAAVEGEFDYNVVVGSLAPTTWNEKAPDPVKFLRDIYEAANGKNEPNLKWLWGSVSYHPYVGPAANPPSADQNFAILPEKVHEVMKEYGDGSKKVWATEFGTPTHGGKYVTDENKLPAWVHDVVKNWYAKEFAGPLFWYSARDKKKYGESVEREDFFGLLYSDFKAKPGYREFKSYFNP